MFFIGFVLGFVLELIEFNLKIKTLFWFGTLEVDDSEGTRHWIWVLYETRVSTFSLILNESFSNMF